MNQTAQCIAYSGLMMAVVSFIVFVFAAYQEIDARRRAADKADQMKPDDAALGGASIEDLSGFATALAKLVESLGKVGPTLTCLIGAVLFLVIAASATGVYTSGSTSPTAAGTAEPPSGKISADQTTAPATDTQLPKK